MKCYQNLLGNCRMNSYQKQLKESVLNDEFLQELSMTSIDINLCVRACTMHILVCSDALCTVYCLTLYIHCTMHSFQCNFYSRHVQFLMQCLCCTVYSLQCRVYSVQYTVYTPDPHPVEAPKLTIPYCIYNPSLGEYCKLLPLSPWQVPVPLAP